MRVSVESDGLRCRAVAGSQVVLMALDVDESRREGLRGFGFKRGMGTGPQRWLEGLKYFADLVPEPQLGAEYSTREHPIQGLVWSDYRADPDTEYHFTIVALYGPIDDLEERIALDFRIRTEKEDDGRHGIWFNRGAIASHALATEFHNRQVSNEVLEQVDEDGRLVDPEAEWLARGLVEACLRFINGARAGDGLRVCAYEFTYRPVIEALKRALERGVDVRIIYHRSRDDHDHNTQAIERARFPAVDGGVQRLFPRTRIGIPHNKFMVLLRGEVPAQVWTGSTNFTPTGFCGQTNVGHLVTMEETAQTYLALWEALAPDPPRADAVAAIARLSADPPNAVAPRSVTPFFSPRAGAEMLQWYANRIGNAASLVIMTLPFNVSANSPLLAGLTATADSLRLVVLENEPTQEFSSAERRNRGKLAFSNGALLGKTFIHERTGGARVEPIRASAVDDWFVEEELARSINSGHVFFVHSKFLVIDALSEDPLICSGSANFSKSSLDNNDENMLLIRGDTRAADIYFTEFDRIFRHFYSRNAINRIARSGGEANPLELDMTDQWLDRHFRPGFKNNRRLAFFAAEPEEPDRWSARAAGDPSPFGVGGP